MPKDPPCPLVLGSKARVSQASEQGTMMHVCAKNSVSGEGSVHSNIRRRRTASPPKKQEPIL